MSEKSAAEVIREARVLLFERGWARGDLRNEHGELCIEGALAVAMVGDSCNYLDEECPALRAVRAAVGDEDWIHAAWWFNDGPGRTFDEVIAVLDRAEKIAEQRAACEEETGTA